MQVRRIWELFRLALLKAWQHDTLRRVTIVSGFFLLLTAILAFNHLSPLESLEVGQISTRNIAAPLSKDIVDEEKTHLMREQKVRSTPPVYTHDPNVLGRTRNEIEQLFRVVLDNQGGSPWGEGGTATLDLAGIKANYGERFEQLKAQVAMVVPEKTLALLVQLRPESLAFLQMETDNLISEIMTLPGLTENNHDWPENTLATRAAGRVVPYTVNEAKAMVEDRIDASKLPAEAKQALHDLVPLFLHPNATLDEDATRRLRNEVRQSVAPVTIQIRQGDLIVREGEVVTEDQVRILSQLGLLRSGATLLRPAGTSLLILVSMAVLFVYLKQFRRELLVDERRMWLLGLLATMTLLTARVITSIRFHDQPEVLRLIFYLAPVATGPMLIALLLDTRVAIFMSALLSLWIGLITDYSIAHGMVAFLGSLVGIYAVSGLSQRMDFARSGLYVAAANITGVLATGLAMGIDLRLLLTYGLPMAGLGGITSAVFMIGSLPYLESAFQITTSVKLLELTNPNHPLLRRLLMEAPGTYHHSLLVGNLGEAAAEEIGADALLVRAGAYYHDIGKIRRPAFFIENQGRGENPHTKIAPTLSTLIITSHVKDGVELCTEAKIPRAVIDVVEQHHGETLVAYFYHRAMEMDRTESVQEKNFRYEGPKPQTKEAALVMLADSAEAAVRSLTQPTHGKIEGLVRKLIKDKLHDGQLEACELTFKDLDRIAESFCRVLNGIYHTRIEYPEQVSKDAEGSRGRSGTVYSG